MQALDDCIKEIRDDPNISTWNEAQAKEWIIRPVLDSLSWGRREIIPEYGVETLWVDYALLINGENKVFIEAKRPSEKLETHQKQLLDYSFGEGVALAILTNGIAWWFYLPLKEGTWNNRKFYTIDILEQEIEDIVDKFGLLLSRQNVASGKAVQHAESILKKRRKEKAIRESLPEAWNSVIKEPHELLVKILKERVVEICDSKPDNSEILRFMRSYQEKWFLSSKVEEPESPAISNSPPSQRPSNGSNQKPRRMQIGSESYELRYKYEILVNTANWLIDNGHLKPSECPVKLTSRAKNYFINRTSERAPDLKFERPKKLKNGLFIEADRSDIAIENAQKLLKKYEYDPEMLKIEY